MSNRIQETLKWPSPVAGATVIGNLGVVVRPLELDIGIDVVLLSAMVTSSLLRIKPGE